MKFKKLFGIALASISLLTGCNNSTSQNSGYDGRVFDISLADRKSVV